MRSYQARASTGWSLLVQAERDEEAAEQERPFGVGQRPVVVAEAVGVAVAGEVAQVGVEGGDGARVVGGDGAAQPGQQQRGVEGRVVGRALPVPVGVQGVRGGVGDDAVGEGEPVRALGRGRVRGGDGAQPGRGGRAGCGSRAGCRSPRCRRRVRSSGG